MVQPEKSFQHGTCRAAVFVNKVNVRGQDVSIKKVVPSKRYKDKSGEWKTTNSLDVNEVPKMIAALTNAYMYVTQSHPVQDEAQAPQVAEEYVR